MSGEEVKKKVEWRTTPDTESVQGTMRRRDETGFGEAPGRR